MRAMFRVSFYESRFDEPSTVFLCNYSRPLSLAPPSAAGFGKVSGDTPHPAKGPWNPLLKSYGFFIISDHVAFPAFLSLTGFVSVSLRRRGLEISSMPKLTKASPAPNRATHKPGAKNHHQAPSRRAALLEAEKSILPQVEALISPRPRYSRAVSARIT